MNKIDEFFNCYIDLQEQTFRQIITEWGHSSATLSRWLKTYHPEILNNKEYSKKAGLNADIFLPYRKGALWSGSDAISRLKLAVKAEVIIIFSDDTLSNKEQFVIYKTECLRLWCRINSLTTKFSFDQFKNLLDDCYKDVITNWDNEVEYLQEKQNAFKYKKDQVLYHFTRADFEPIRYEKNLKTAYNVWMEQVFPTLLDKYKERKLKEYRIELGHVTFEEWQKKSKAYQIKLDKIKITPIKYIQFTKLIKKIKNGELA